MPERNDYKTGRSGGGYNGGNGNGGFNGGNAFGGAGGGPLGAYVPPHSIEAEQSTLGAMLIERTAVEKVFEILDKEDFLPREPPDAFRRHHVPRRARRAD